ncbi:MAG TPA: hypothetical protein VFC15_14500, partial [Candidatus Limnocylindrales bacterium]|nr:hypothetical protein [Candidatus Limnocylindrales bacterium]
PWKSLRDCHISTAPATARLVQYKIKKGAFLSHILRLPPGSFFNWKRLLMSGGGARERRGGSRAGALINFQIVPIMVQKI